MNRQTPLTLLNKIPVQLIGSTGLVGRQMISLLSNHPWFEITKLSGARSIGKTLKEVDPSFVRSKYASWKIEDSQPNEAKLVFSALGATVAKDLEREYLGRGKTIFSNASAYRMDPNHLLSLPEISYPIFEKLEDKPIIITNPNCCVSALALLLYHIMQLRKINSLHVVTQQSLSGAGYPGVSSLDIQNNVLLTIANEEEKIIEETKKLLEKTQSQHSWEMYATCTRVPMDYGHIIHCHMQLESPIETEDFIEHLKGFYFKQDLPSACASPIQVVLDSKQFNPKLIRLFWQGMEIYVGNVQVKNSTVQLTIYSHNLIRGAAGSALLNAELWVKTHYLYRDSESKELVCTN